MGEMIRQQARHKEEAANYEGKCQELENSQEAIARITDRLNSFEMDCERMSTKHQDEFEEWSAERNRLVGEKNGLEERIHLLQASIGEVEETKGQQNQDIVMLSAQNASLQKKCNILKEKVTQLIEKNKAWEDSYKASSDDLVLHGMEISRLNGQVSDLK